MVSDGSWWDCNAAAPISGGGPDGALSPEGTFNLGTDTSNGRSYADGIAYKVTSNPNSTSINVGQTANGFADGDKAILINLQGTAADNSDVGNYEILDVTGTNENNILVDTQPTKSYDGSSWANQAVVIQRIPQYSNVTLNGSDTLTASAWDGLATTPTSAAGVQTGIIAFYANGTVAISDSATIDASLKGFRGGASGSSTGPEYWGGRWTQSGDAGDAGSSRVNCNHGGNGGNGGGSLVGGAGGTGFSCDCNMYGTDGENGTNTGDYATGGGGGAGGPGGQSYGPSTGTSGDAGRGYAGGGGGSGRGDNFCSGGYADEARGGGGGGAKPYDYSVTESTKTTDVFSKIGLGAGSPAGGGGGGAGSKTSGGAGGSITGGLSGNPGGGIILIKAYSVDMISTGLIHAGGGTGGAGGGGMSLDSYSARGGGGAGAQGASGGSIYIDSESLTSNTEDITANGGTGGGGGGGGGNLAGVAGGVYINGNDVGDYGMGGKGYDLGGKGAGGGGGNSGFSGKIYFE